VAHEPESQATLAGHTGLRSVLSGHDNRLRPTLLPCAGSCTPTRLDCRSDVLHRRPSEKKIIARTATPIELPRCWMAFKIETPTEGRLSPVAWEEKP
jgi:hypothetical protein